MHTPSTRGTPSRRQPSASHVVNTPTKSGSRPNSGVFASPRAGGNAEKAALLADSPAAKWFRMRVDEVADETEGEAEDKSMWDGGIWEDEEDMSMELVTELGEEEVDPDMDNALMNVRTIHLRKLLHYKRLLERAQASSAAQLHALQAEIKLLRENSSSAIESMPIQNDIDYCVCGGKKRKGYWGGYRRDDEDGDVGDVDLITALKTFNETDVRKAVRGMSRDDRMRL